MAKFQDLTGQRFGDLLVLRRAPDYISPTGKKTVRWECLCENCGRKVTMLRNALKEATSCGCRKGEKLYKDLTGQRFGRWTVLKRVRRPAPHPNGSWYDWLCRCDCGTERLVDAKSLTTGASRSCGCTIGEEALKRIDPAGKNDLQRYGGTTVSAIRPERKPNSNNKSSVLGVYWSNREQCWIAKIGFRGKSITIGRFNNLGKAELARIAAEEDLFDPVIRKYDAIQAKKRKKPAPWTTSIPCKFCGNLFLRTAPHQLYCPECRAARNAKKTRDSKKD